MKNLLIIFYFLGSGKIICQNFQQINFYLESEINNPDIFLNSFSDSIYYQVGDSLQINYFYQNSECVNKANILIMRENSVNPMEICKLGKAKHFFYGTLRSYLRSLEIFTNDTLELLNRASMEPFPDFFWSIYGRSSNQLLNSFFNQPLTQVQLKNIISFEHLSKNTATCSAFIDRIINKLHVDSTAFQVLFTFLSYANDTSRARYFYQLKQHFYEHTSGDSATVSRVNKMQQSRDYIPPQDELDSLMVRHNRHLTKLHKDELQRIQQRQQDTALLRANEPIFIREARPCWADTTLLSYNGSIPIVVGDDCRRFDTLSTDSLFKFLMIYKLDSLYAAAHTAYEINSNTSIVHLRKVLTILGNRYFYSPFVLTSQQQIIISDIGEYIVTRLETERNTDVYADLNDHIIRLGTMLRLKYYEWMDSDRRKLKGLIASDYSYFFTDEMVLHMIAKADHYGTSNEVEKRNSYLEMLMHFYLIRTQLEEVDMLTRRPLRNFDQLSMLLDNHIIPAFERHHFPYK